MFGEGHQTSSPHVQRGIPTLPKEPIEGLLFRFQHGCDENKKVKGMKGKLIISKNIEKNR